MKLLARNLTSFQYALYQSKTYITDDYGNQTSEYKITYGTPVTIKANISTPTGVDEMNVFGSEPYYDKIIIVDDMNCPIDENSVLCIDKPASYDSDGNLLYDYVVSRVAKSFNCIRIFANKVSKQ